VEVAPYKEEPADFVLWKPADPGDPGWDSPWSRGRPGWHIECSAMIEQELGLPIDIHGGGHDLIFPHHENELAQARGATGADALAEIWMHNGFLDLDGSKMSKSLGNGLQVHDLLQDRPGEVLRWALLKGHYRSPLEWTDSLLDQSRRELDYLYGVLRRAGPSQTPPSREPLGLEPLLDDLNTPAAMGRLHALAHEVEQGGSGAGEALSAMGGLAAVLGVLQQDPETWFQGGVDPTSLARIQTLISERDEARRARNFAEADRLRAELDALGVVVMDAPGGASWRLKE
jgi:cysteinyl-tRNA synthetase